MYPFEGSPESHIAKKVKEMNEAITGNRLPYGYLPFSTDGGFLTGKMRIPSVIYGPCRIQEAIVSKENVKVENILLAVRVYAASTFEILHRMR